MFKNRPIYKIIKEICLEEEISLKEVSYGYVTELEKDGIKKRIVGNSLEINSANSYKIASDKYATYELLKANGIPTIEHFILFNPETRVGYSKNELEKADKFFSQNDSKVILKANDSSEGKDVFEFKNKEELNLKIKELFENKKDTLSVCPFYDIDFEYRVIYLDGKVLFMYKKVKPQVIGDGKKTLEELINENNILDIYDYLDLNYIPKENEIIEVSWKHNLSRGAKPYPINDKNLEEKLEKIAIKAAKAIGIRFATIDIDHIKNKDDLLVMEINSSVCMDKFIEEYENGENIAKSVFKKAINTMMNVDF